MAPKLPTGSSGLPAIKPTGTGVSTTKGPGLPGLPKTPSTSVGHQISGGIKATVARAVKSAIEEVERKEVDVVVIVDKTASTSDVAQSFISRARQLAEKRSGKNVVQTFTPVIFSGNGISVGDPGNTTIYNGDNISGQAPIFSALETAAKQLRTNSIGVIGLLTDTIDETNSGSAEASLKIIQEKGALLLIMLDLTEFARTKNRFTIESLTEYYQQQYGSLGENLIIVSGDFSPHAITQAFIDEKIKAQIGNGPGKKGVNLQDMLPDLNRIGGISGGKGQFQISSGLGKPLQIGND